MVKRAGMPRREGVAISRVSKSGADEVSDDENGEIKGVTQRNPGVIYKTG
jgi:hypothetical protein